MNININLNYFIFVIIGFVGINSLADVIFEMRYLFSMNSLLSYKTGQVTDMFYNISLMFVSLALIIYNVNIKNKAFDTMSNWLKDSKLLIEDIIMQAPYAICIFDNSGDLVSVNDSFLRLFNVKRADVVRNYNLFSDTNDIGIKLHPGTLKLKQGKKIFMPNIEFRQNGNIIYLSVKAFPVYGANNLISNYVTIIEDITERLNAVQELVSAKTQAELYVDLMGHDINNIHQIALGYLELARDMPVGEQQAMFLDKPVEVLQRSTKLISNVRKLQKLRDGMVQEQDVDVCKVLSDVQREYGTVPDKTITLSLNGFEHCHVRANELLHDVFSNLVGNAVKHTGDRAAIVVGLDVVEDDGGRYCRVAVEDDGPGIPDDFKATIFNRALRGTNKAKGMGLGLYLVKSLVDSYGGRVWVEDRIIGDHTKGARFVVMLPMVDM
jgi:PAS domain S-box-containing protein